MRRRKNWAVDGERFPTDARLLTSHLLSRRADFQYWSYPALKKLYVGSLKTIIKLAQYERREIEKRELQQGDKRKGGGAKAKWTRLITQMKRKLSKVPNSRDRLLRTIYEEILRSEHMGTLRGFGLANEYGSVVLGNPETQSVYQLIRRSKQTEGELKMARISKSDLEKVAKELNKTLGLVNEETGEKGISTKNMKTMRAGIVEALTEVISEEDEFTKKTQKILDQIREEEGLVDDEEEPEDEELEEDEEEEDEDEEEEEEDEEEEEEDEEDEDEEDEEEEEEEDEEEDEEDEDEEEDEEDEDEEEDEEDEDEEEDEEEEEEEEEEDEEDEEEEKSLIDLVRDTSKLADLKDIVKENDELKSLKKKLKSYQGLHGPKELKRAMLIKLGVPEEELKPKPKKPSKPVDHSKSNKAQVWKAWKDGETKVKKLHKKIKGAVKEATISSWIKQWEKGNALPAIAKQQGADEKPAKKEKKEKKEDKTKKEKKGKKSKKEKKGKKSKK